MKEILPIVIYMTEIQIYASQYYHQMWTITTLSFISRFMYTGTIIDSYEQ
jgi:hypothetical protein